MSMSLLPSCSQQLHLSPRLTQRLEPRLTLEQRLRIDGYLHGLFVELAGNLRSERYQPKAKCPKCSRDLEPPEILRGFLDLVDDFTTECPGCHHRFMPRLICFIGTGPIELMYFCPKQVLARLALVQERTPADIARVHPSEYRSAVIHYGTLKAAFAEIGVAYAHPEISAWESKVQPFLGRLPDTAIARCAGVSTNKIRARRKAAGLPAFRRRAALVKAKAADRGASA